MKKLVSFILCLSVALTLCIGASPVSAKEITVEMDGKIIAFDVAPAVINGRTLVPLRKIFEEIGATVKWNDETQTVSARKNSKTVTLRVAGKNYLYP